LIGALLCAHHAILPVTLRYERVTTVRTCSQEAKNGLHFFPVKAKLEGLFFVSFDFSVTMKRKLFSEADDL